MTTSTYDDYRCPGCDEPLPITGVRQRRTLDGGGLVYHNRECQKAASQQTRPCRICSTPVTRRRSSFKGAYVLCSEHRGMQRLNKQSYPCATCGAKVERAPSHIVGAIYCSKECSAAAQRGRRVSTACARTECGNLVAVTEDRAAKPAGRGSAGVFCSVECRKQAARIEVPCAGGCGRTQWRYRSQMAKRADGGPPRVFCAECRKTNGMKPRRGASKPCATCGNAVYRRPSEDDGGPRYCNKSCYGKSLQDNPASWPTRNCVVCGNGFRMTWDRIRHDVKTCSRACTIASRRRRPEDRYVDSKGYAWITTPDGRSMFEHRYVMEQAIGRPLLPTETVHHKTGGKAGRSNNDLSNLELWSGRHPKGHRVEDVVQYAREMLAVYGAADEVKRYRAYRAAVESDPGDASKR